MASTTPSLGGAFQPGADYNLTGAIDFATIPTAGSNGSVATTTGTQTLTNKTLTAPTITAPTITGAASIATGATIKLTFASVAAAGSSVTDATAVSSGSGAIILGTGGDGTKGIKFPTGAAGDFYIVKNDDAANAILKVYAASGGKINNGSSNAALSMAAKTCALFACIAADSWVSLSLLPS